MARIQRWGNSLAVRIPAALAAQAEAREGLMVDIEVVEGTILIRPRRRRRYRLKDLLRNCKPRHLHGEADFGQDVGREIVE